MAARPMFALALSLQPKATPKIVPVEELHLLKANNVAVSLEPTSVNDFEKGLEYGRFVVIDGQRKLVRYVIFRLDYDVEKLRAHYETTKTEKRFKPPKRVSTAPTVDDAKLYRVLVKKAVPAAKNVKSKAVTSANDSIYSKFQKKQKKESAGASGDVNTSPTPKATCSNNEDPVSPNIDAQKASSHSSSNGAAAQTLPTQCLDLNHIALQVELNEALSKYERALIEVKFLRNRVKKDDDNVLQILKKLEAKLDSLSLKSSDAISEGKESDLDQLSNLVDDDEEVPDSDEVKIDDDKYVEKAELFRIEKEFTCLRPRVEELVKLMCEEQPDLFGISGFTNSGEALLKFTPAMQDSVLKILQAMKWNTMPKGLIKGNINHRISSYLSAERKAKKVEQKEPKTDASASHNQQAASSGETINTDEYNVSDDDKEPPGKKPKKGDDNDDSELMNTSIDL